MGIFKNFNFEEMTNKIKNDKYNVIYINYEKSNGIKIIYNLSDLTEKEKSNFYKIYIFNDNYMITVYKFAENDFRYIEIKKDDFEKIIYEQKNIYLNEVKEKKIKVRVGEVKIGNEIKECIQYTGFIEGDE